MFPLLAFFLTMFRRHRYRSDSGSRRTRGVKYCRRDPLLSSLDVGGLKWTWKISSEMPGVAHLQLVAVIGTGLDARAEAKQARLKAYRVS